MMLRVLASAALCAIATSASAASGPTLQDRQQAACYDDVMRLCSEFVPNVEQVTTCMTGKRKLVGPACAAFYPKERK